MRYLVYFVWFILLFCSCKTSTKKTAENSTIPTTTAIGCTPEITDKSWYSSGKKAPLFESLEGIQFSISTTDSTSQRYFNQGLMLAIGFNHAEAARSFFEAARIDSNCAMAWWGFAYVLGPNYNGGMEKDNFIRAFDAVQKAKTKSNNATPLEKDLIDALTFRYSNDTAIERSTLDAAYADAMRKVYKKYPSNANVVSLYAEALLDLHPWNLWQKDGSMQPWTTEIISVLKKGLELDPRHAGIHHFYVHAIEMSKHPENAMASADILLDLVPGAGHLVHMPSHIYIRTGRYHDGTVSNLKAVQVDSSYLDACHAQGAYPLAYYPHNYHFIAACATLSGESKSAVASAIATANHAHKKLLRDPDWATLQHYYSIPWYVQVKLGLWNDIINSPQPEQDLKYPTIIWNYAQGMANLTKNNLSQAKDNLQKINTIMADSSIKDLTIWGINSLYDLCIIAAKTLGGEIAAKEKDYSKAISLLKEAVATEDALNYNEPPDWFFSVRHHLGAILIDAGKYKEAISIYKKDLEIYPENGWALKGLQNAYEKLNDKKNAEISKNRFEKAWQYADIQIGSSRII